MSEPAYRDLGRIPIPGAHAEGRPARDGPDFEALGEEIAKLGMLEPAAVDWVLVREIAARILSAQSKDLLVACYLCRALVETEGYVGLSHGAGVLADLVEHFWAALFPPSRRLPARLAALDWLFRALVAFIEREPPSAAVARAARHALDAFDRLDGLVASHIEADRLADIASCRRLLAEGLAQTERPPLEVREAERPPPPVSSAGKTAGDISPLVLDLSGERARRKALTGLAAELRSASLADPLAYRVLRAAAWAAVTDCPPHDAEGRTHIPPVSPERVRRCRALLADGDYDNAVRALEEGLSRAPYWLDAQRMVAGALTALGHARARRAVEQDTQNLMTDLPKLKVLRFNNGEPLADADTMGWIERLAGEAQAAERFEPAEAPPGGDPAPVPRSVRRDARRLDREGRFDEAVALFTAGATAAATVREIFLWRTAQAEFLLSAGHCRLALGQLEQLDVEAERYRLDEWEPALAAGVARALLECYKKRGGKSQVGTVQAERLHAALSRLSRLDPSSALVYADIRIRC